MEVNIEAVHAMIGLRKKEETPADDQFIIGLMYALTRPDIPPMTEDERERFFDMILTMLTKRKEQKKCLTR